MQARNPYDSSAISVPSLEASNASCVVAPNARTKARLSTDRVDMMHNTRTISFAAKTCRNYLLGLAILSDRSIF